MNEKNTKLILFITFLSGFSFLIYEVSWNRYLSLILGTTVVASTIVLMSFMLGFGLGANFLSKKIEIADKKIKFLSFLLGGIGLFSLINFFLISKGLSQFYSIFDNIKIADFFSFSLIFLILLVPAFFMGGVIPLVSKMIISETKEISTKLGNIYALETLGSTIGGIATGFVFLGNFGQTTTILIAVGINIILSIFLFLKSSKVIENKTITDNPEKIIQEFDKQNSKIAKISTLIFGFTILALQIIWIRIFKTYFTNTSYTFSMITSFVILGLSLGSWFYRKKGTQIKNEVITLQKSLLSLAFLSFVGLFLLIFLPEILMFPFKNFGENPFFRTIIIPLLASILIVLPPTFVSGFAFPLSCKLNTPKTENIGKNVGNILMYNTIGSFIGPAVATFILIPLLGSSKSILFCILIILFSVYYITKIKQKTKKNIENKSLFLNKNLILTLFVIILFSIIFIKEIKILPPSIKNTGKELLVYNENTDGTIVIVNEKEKVLFGKSAYINNSQVIGSNFDAIKAVKMVGHLPFFSGLECKNALIIGFGIGVTTSVVASYPEVEKIDCVELMPKLLDEAKYFSLFNNSVAKNKKLNLIKGDGRHFLQMTNNKYDLISCDPTHPVLGSGNLYTKEYFVQCWEHLNAEGMISQYLPIHKLSLENLLRIIKTFNSVFPNSTVWLGQYHAILFGMKSDEKIDFEKWTKIIENLPYDDFFYLDSYHIASAVVLDGKKIQELTKEIKIITDDLNSTEFFKFDDLKEENVYKNLKFIAENRINQEDVFTKFSEDSVFLNYKEGNKYLTECLYYTLQRDYDNSLSSLEKASEVNPENQEYQFLLKFYFGKN